MFVLHSQTPAPHIRLFPGIHIIGRDDPAREVQYGIKHASISREHVRLSVSCDPPSVTVASVGMYPAAIIRSTRSLIALPVGAPPATLELEDTLVLLASRPNFARYTLRLGEVPASARPVTDSLPIALSDVVDVNCVAQLLSNPPDYAADAITRACVQAWWPLVAATPEGAARIWTRDASDAAGASTDGQHMLPQDSRDQSCCLGSVVPDDYDIFSDLVVAVATYGM